MPTFFNLNPINFFILSGIIQNFVITGILFWRRGEQPVVNRMLATIILILDLHLLFLMLLDTNLDNIYPTVLWVPYSFVTAVGPLFYLYTCWLTGETLPARQIIHHLLPVGVELLLQLLMIVQAVGRGQLIYNTPLYFYLMPAISLWAAFSMLYYARLSLALIQRHEEWVRKNYSNVRELTLRWLQKLIAYFHRFWVIWVPFVALFLVFFRFQLQYFPVVLTLYLLMLVLTYLVFWIGLQGLERSPLMVVKRDKTPNKNFAHLGKDELQHHATALRRLMIEEYAYRDENLGLRDCASRLHLDPNLVSFVLNNYVNKTFHDFVNEYRVEEVKARFADPAYVHLTLLGIALESGFNSKTTFNRVFKQMTGMTPSAYQKK